MYADALGRPSPEDLAKHHVTLTRHVNHLVLVRSWPDGIRKYDPRIGFQALHRMADTVIIWSWPGGLRKYDARIAAEALLLITSDHNPANTIRDPLASVTLNSS